MNEKCVDFYNPFNPVYLNDEPEMESPEFEICYYCGEVSDIVFSQREPKRNNEFVKICIDCLTSPDNNI